MSLSSPSVTYFHPGRMTTSLHQPHSLLLQVDADPGSDCVCSVVSVQSPQCPIFDSLETSMR